MTKLSFGFIVGGGDTYYKNLMRACESLERIKQDHEIVIIDMEDRLSIDDPKVKIVKASREELKNEDSRNWFQPHIWAERYNLFKHVETEHCFYMDTDTVVINDRVDELIEEAQDNFLCTQHWWVPTLADYMNKVEVMHAGLSNYLPDNRHSYNYASSGAFLFQKDKHDHIFNRYGEIFEDIFKDGGVHPGVTDEFVLCLTLNELGGYHFTNGAFNHCAANDQQDMKLIDGVFYGKNPQEDDYEKVFLFHSAYQNISSLITHSPAFHEDIKKVMYWEDYQ